MGTRSRQRRASRERAQPASPPPIPIQVPLIGQQQPQPKPVSFMLQKHDVPSVHPHYVQQQAETPDRHVVQIHQFGGLTPLEWMVGQVAGGVQVELGDAANPTVREIVDVAEALLRECTARQVTVAPDEDSEGHDDPGDEAGGPKIVVPGEMA